jgi:hypothetical protein
MIPADGFRLKSLLGPHDPHHSPEDYKKAVQELHNIGLVHVWIHQDLPWLYVIGHDQEQKQALRSRKTDPEVPRPLAEEMDRLAEERASKYTNNKIKVYGQQYIGSTQAEDKPKTSSTQAEDKPKTSRHSRDLKRDLKREEGSTTETQNNSSLSSFSEIAQTEDKEQRTSPTKALEAGIEPPLSASVLGAGNKSATPPATPPATPHTPAIHSRSDRHHSVASGMDCPPAMIQDKRPIASEHAEIWELLALHAKKWKIEQPTALPTHDNLKRILQALRELGFTGCQAAIYGHHKAANKEGSQMGREYWHVFPVAKINGQAHTHKLDQDRFRSFVAVGEKIMPNKKTENRQKQIKKEFVEKDDQEIKEIAELVGIKPGDSFKKMVSKFKEGPKS